MEDNFIIVTINGTTYYIEASRVNDLEFIDNKLVNVSNNSITMVNHFDYQNTYPRITCSAMSQCILRPSSTVSYYGVTNPVELPKTFNSNQLGLYKDNIIIMLLVIILGVKLIWKR